MDRKNKSELFFSLNLFSALFSLHLFASTVKLKFASFVLEIVYIFLCSAKIPKTILLKVKTVGNNNSNLKWCAKEKLNRRSWRYMKKCEKKRSFSSAPSWKCSWRCDSIRINFKTSMSLVHFGLFWHRFDENSRKNQHQLKHKQCTKWVKCFHHSARLWCNSKVSGGKRYGKSWYCIVIEQLHIVFVFVLWKMNVISGRIR